MDFLPKLSMKNRAFIALVTVIIMIFGGFSISGLRQELIPSVELPAVGIIATNPGASAEQMAESVAEPLEKELRTLERVESTDSVSNSNFSMITIEMEFGADSYRAASQTDVIINRIADDLPDGTETQVLTGGSSDIPAMVVALSSDLSAGKLQRTVEDSVIPDIESVNGVATVQVFGGTEEIIRITADEAKLSDNGLTEGDIVDALDNAGLSVPGGSITEDDETLDLTLGRGFNSVEDIEDMVLATEEPPSVRLADVADVEIVEAEPMTASRNDGKDAITMLIMPATDANFVELSDDVQGVFDDAEQLIGSNTTFSPIFDQAPFIQESISGLATESLWGLGIAVAVIFVFLLSIRPTIISGISIPLSVLFAFVGMLVTGTTLNMMSLAGLMISIGRMVDDSIVVIENIIRHFRQPGAKNKSKAKIIVEATAEVSSAVVSSTLVAILVFVPILFVSGIAGELFRPFGLTVVLALLGSTLVALTIVPVLAYWFMSTREKRAKRGKKKDKTEDAAEPAVEPALETAGAQLATAEAADEAADVPEPDTNWMSRVYRPILKWSLAHRVTSLIAAVAIFVGSLALAPLLKINLLGDSGMNMHMASQTVDDGTSLDAMIEMSNGPTEVLLDIDGVSTVQADMGAQPGLGFGAANEISYTIVTDPDANQSDIEADIDAALKEYGKDHPNDGTFEMLEGGSFLGSDTIDVLIQAIDDDTLVEASDLLTEEIGNLDTVERATSDLEASAPGIRIVPRPEDVAQLGMTENDVIGMVASYTADYPVGSIRVSNDELNVHLSKEDVPETVKELEDLNLYGIPLDAVADVERVNQVPSITTIDSVRTVTIATVPASMDNVGATTDDIDELLDTIDLPDGTDVRLSGVAEDIDTTFAQLGLAMLAAILLIYVVLVWLLKSLVQPLILLMAVPFALTGMIIALLITGTPLGLPSLVGLLMLIGIVVTNSIVLMDLVNQYRRRGLELDDAIILGGQNRVRPILMTAAATIGAMIPPAIGISSSSSFVSAPMSIAVIGGLIASTLITLVIVPVLYRTTEGWAQKLQKKDRKNPGDVEPDSVTDSADEETAPTQGVAHETD